MAAGVEFVGGDSEFRAEAEFAGVGDFRPVGIPRSPEIEYFCRKATVLAGKLVVFIFQESVHEDDKFAHASRQRDFGFFAAARRRR